ncbi:MAG: DNA primase [Bacilli bacterium]|nr:DNA primase [Bacilli bacterium]
MNNQSIFNEIREKIDIVDLIGEYVPLVQKGRNFFGVCPFHNDTNPSMSVSRDKQIYKCFSCGASGNIFTFIRDYEHMDMKDVLELLAPRAGVTLNTTNIQRKTTKYDKFYEIYNLTNKFYQNNINTKDGMAAKEYLKNRQISEEVIKEFEIGLSLDSMDSLTKVLTKKGYDILTLDKIGLSSNNHDLFINRIMVPIHDISGRVVAFSGRIYNKKSDHKYVNTKETEIFRKGTILYNYHRCKETARRSKYVIVMEGYMDVFRAASVDIKNVVAIMGTALTIEQANLIKKLSNNVYLCLDGDAPGQKAMLSIGEELEKNGLNVKIITLTNNEDPDTYILKYGKEGFEDQVEKAISFSDFKLQSLKKGVNFASDLELSNYVNSVIREASSIEDEIRREIILKKLALETNLSYNTLEKRLNEYLEKRQTKNVVIKELKPNNKLSKYEKAVYGMIYAILTDYKYFKKFQDESLYFVDQKTRYLLMEIEYYYKKFGNIEIPDFYTYLLEKGELLELYNNIINYVDINNISEEAVNDFMSVIRSYNLRLEINRLTEMMKKQTNDLEKAKIAERIKALRIGE